MKLRAKKGEGAVSAEELEEHAARPHLPHRRRGRPAGSGFAARRHRRSPPPSRSTHRHLRITKMSTSNCNAISIAKKNPATAPRSTIARSLNLPLLATNGVCYAIRQSPRTLRRLHRHPPPPHSLHRRTPARPQLRTLSEISAGDAATLRRPARSHRQHARTF